MVSKFRINEALRSYGALNSMIDTLTMEEVLASLDLEAATRRRQSILDRLISRAVRLNEISFTRQLKEKYHGTESKNSDPR